MSNPGGYWDLMWSAVRTDEYGYPAALGHEYERAWYNQTRHLWAFYVGTENSWIVAASLVPTYRVGNVLLRAVPNLFYGGHEVLAGATATGTDPHVLFFSPHSNLWIFRNGSSVSEPRSYLDLDGETVLGDAWHAGYFGALPYPVNGSTPSASLSPEGTASGGMLTLELAWPRWKRRSGIPVLSGGGHPISHPPVGVYEPVDQTASDIVIGTPVWRDGTGALYERSDEKDESGNWRYGSISHSNGYWSPDGAEWPRSASEPSRDSRVSFLDEAGEETFYLEFAGLSPGQRTAIRYYAEACVWRA